MAEKIRIAFVGLRFGRSMINQIRESANAELFDIVAVCDLDCARAQEVAAELGVRAYDEIDMLLECSDIEAIGLFTGPVGRAELIHKIIRSGKDVMTTKPFELDAYAAREVLNEAERLCRVIHMNSPSPLLSEDMRIIEDWRAKYDLGRPVACRSECWANYREAANGSWYDDPDFCPAAPIYRLGIYLINDLLLLMGEPQSVSVMQSRLFTGRPTSDNAQMGILFKNGAIANVFSSFCVNDGQQYRNSLIVNYENGTIYRNVGVMKDAEINDLAVIAQGGAVRETAESKEHSGIYQWDAFYRAVCGEDVCGAVRREAYHNQVVDGIRVVEAMRRAQGTGEMVCLA